MQFLEKLERWCRRRQAFLLRREAQLKRRQEPDDAKPVPALPLNSYVFRHVPRDLYALEGLREWRASRRMMRQMQEITVPGTEVRCGLTDDGQVIALWEPGMSPNDAIGVLNDAVAAIEAQLAGDA